MKMESKKLWRECLFPIFYCWQKQSHRTRVALIALMAAVITILTFSFEARCGRPIKPQKIENTQALEKFFTALQTSEQQWSQANTRMIHYGDSHVAADWLTGKIRRNFQRDFGAEFITYENKGMNGARATKPLSWDWGKVAEDFASHQPALIVVAYGTNEAGDVDLDLTEYKKNFSALLQHFNAAAPEASLLVIAPPDRAMFRNGKWRSLASLPALIETQRQAAFAEGAAFWNQSAAMGGAGAINVWANYKPQLAQKDHVHLTLAGYELIADAFYDQLTQEYANFLVAQ